MIDGLAPYKTGRAMTEFEDWLLGEMLLLNREITRRDWAMLTMRGAKIYVVEDEQGVAGTLLYASHDKVNIVVGEVFWVRPDLRKVTNMMEQLIQGVLHETGRHVIVHPVAEWVQDDNPRSFEETQARYAEFGRQVIIDGSVLAIGWNHGD